MIIFCTSGRRSRSMNMCSRAAQADAVGTERAGAGSVTRGVGVGVHAQGAELVGPRQQLGSLVGELLGADEGQGALDDLAGGAVHGEDVTLVEHAAVHLDLLLVEVDLQGFAAHHAGDAPSRGPRGLRARWDRRCW